MEDIERNLLKSDLSSFKKETNVNCLDNDTKNLKNLYKWQKKKPWTPFVYCPLITVVIFLIFDIHLIFFVFSLFIWMPIACFIAAYKVRYNNDLRRALEINTPEEDVKSKVTEGVLLGVGLYYLKGGGKVISNAFKPSNKEV